MAAVNGVAHAATRDGWWAGGCTGRNGWVIDSGRTLEGGAQDAADAQALYALIEQEIVPAFYDRSRTGVSARWSAIMKESIATTLPRFCARRVVKAFADAGSQPA